MTTRDEPPGRGDGAAASGNLRWLWLTRAESRQRTRDLLVPRSGLAQRLGCTLMDDGAVQVIELGQTTVPGVYAAGDMC